MGLTNRFFLVPAVVTTALVVTLLWLQGSAKAWSQLDQPRELAIYGTVAVPGTRVPVPGVIVRLRNASLESAETSTDDSGRFSFTGLSPGGYGLAVVLPDGSTSVYRDVQPVGEGPPLDVQLWFAPLSRVSGRVIDPSGEPAAGVYVSLEQRAWTDGRRALVGGIDGARLPVRTDEDGFFEMFAPPGQYYLKASDPNSTGTPPHYYPGVLNPEEAVPLFIRAGIDLPGTVLERRERTDLYRVRFQLSDSAHEIPAAPQPLSTYLAPGTPLIEGDLRFLGLGLVDQSPYTLAFEQLDNDTWLGPPLPPGRYDLLVRYHRLLSRGLRSELGWALDDPQRYQFDPILRVAFSIVEEDVDLGVFSREPRTAVAGRVVADGLSSPTLDMNSFPDILLREVAFGAVRRSTAVAQDGSFVVQGLYQGTYRFTVARDRIPNGWYIGSVRLAGHDVLQQGLEVGGAPLGLLEVSVRNDGGRIQGTIRTSEAALVPNARVVLIPMLGSRGPFTEFITATASASGSYVLSDVPPGDFRILALDSESDSAATFRYWEDPQFIQDYESRGQLISVDPGIAMTVHLEALRVLD